jgi:hypothetical protein
MSLLAAMLSPGRRDPSKEREETGRRLEESRPDGPIGDFREGIGRIPSGPARGWRHRAQKAKSCEQCEGDLWIGKDGILIPCPCRERGAAKRTANRLLAGNWMRGTSLSFAAPPLAVIAKPGRDAVEAVCRDVLAKRNVTSLWLQGSEGSGKSALCAYLAQRLFPSNAAIVEHVGDLLAHLRWLGGAKGEAMVEKRLEKLANIPLLVLDDVDRPTRSHPSSVPLAFESSLMSHDLTRLAWLLRERQGRMKPSVITSRATPSDCSDRLRSISRRDLVRGLLGTALGASDPFEDFPAYAQRLLEGVLNELRNEAVLCPLDQADEVAMAA